MRIKREPEVVSFKRIHIKVPKKRLQALFYKDKKFCIKSERKLKIFLTEASVAQGQLLHAISVAKTILIRNHVDLNDRT